MDGMFTEMIVYGAKFFKSSQASRKESSLQPSMISLFNQKLDSSGSFLEQNSGTKICKKSNQVREKYKKD